MILIVLLIVLVWLLVTCRDRERRRNCRWREDRARDTAEGRYFVCMFCGAEALRNEDTPPTDCLSGQER